MRRHLRPSSFTSNFKQQELISQHHDTFMQSCTRAARRSACGAHNAYSPAKALRSTFVTTSKCRQDEDNDSSSIAAERLQWISRQWSLAQIARQSARQRYRREGSSTVRQKSSEVPPVIQKVASKPPPVKTKSRRVYKQQSRSTAAGDGSLQWIDEVLLHGPSQRATIPPDETWRHRLSSGRWQRQIANLRDRLESLKTMEGRQKLRELSHEQRAILRQEFDYAGHVILPHESNKRTPEPWALTRQEVNRLMKDHAKEIPWHHMLTLEIQRFEEYMTPTPVERAARQAIADEVIDFITTTLVRDDPGKTACEVFGSEKTGLAMPVSDIDIRIFDITDRPAVWYRMDRRMEYLQTAIRDSDKYILSVLRKTGRYPIINCQHRESGIDIQIVASPETSRQQEVTTKYLARLPYLRPLFYLVRTMLAMRGLLDVYSGGLGSYGTFIMVLAYMNRNQSGFRKHSVSSHFRRFLTEYDESTRHGMTASRHGIAVFPRFKFLKHDADKRYQQYNRLALKRGNPVRAAQWTMCQRKPLQPYLLTLQDPADPKNDLGKKSNAIKHIFATISYHRYLLKIRGRNNDQCQRKGEAWREESFLLPFVGRCHEIYAGPRRRLREYGEKILGLKGLSEQQEMEERKEVEMLKTAEAFAAAPDEVDTRDEVYKPLRKE